MKLIIAFVMSCVLLSFSGCAGRKSARNEKYLNERGFFAMDTYMTLKVSGDDSAEALDAAEKRVRELENTFSVNIENSDIWRINHSQGIPAEVSADTLEAVQKSLEISRKTEGALDISLYPIVMAWGFTTENYRIPPTEEISELLGTVNWQNVSANDGRIFVPKDYMLDLGALAKGYTGDELMKIFRENGVESAIISLGGNVQTLGKKPDGSLWKVAVRDPFAPETDMCVVETADKAVITSGSYERYFTGEDGVDYCHIIDPKSGRPVNNGLVSVTVVGESGAECDALSTALFVMGIDAAAEFWRKNSNFELIMATADGKIFYTEGLDENFKNLSKMPAEVILRA